MEDQVQNPTNPTDQVTPVTVTPNKEGGSALVSEQGPKISEEVSAIGVEAVTDEPKLDEIHERIGVVHAPASTPAITEPSGKVQLPIDAISEQEAREIAKKGEGSDLDVSKHQDAIYSAPSILGLAVLKLKQILRTRLFGQSA